MWPWSSTSSKRNLLGIATALAAGLLDPKTAADYRARVLERGGSADADELVRDFLGRPRSDAAYKAFLVGGSAPVAKGPR